MITGALTLGVRVIYLNPPTMSNSATKYSPGAYSILYFNDLGVRVNKEILPDSMGYLKAREQAWERSATEGYASYVINRVLFNSALKEQERYDVRK